MFSIVPMSSPSSISRSLLSSLLCLAALFGSGCAALDPLPPPLPSYDQFPLARFDRVDDNLYRGAHPTDLQLRALVTRYHIRTVIKLNPDWQGRDHPPPGVRFIDEPIPAVWTPDPAALDRILDEIEAAPKPVFLHCRTGADRAGLIVALYRLRHGATVEAAYEEMVRHGFRRYRGVWRAWNRAVERSRSRATPRGS